MSTNNPEHILVVDDEPLIRKSLHEILRLEGYKVISASSATEALQKIKENNVNIVITDVKMPGMDGIELLKAIKKDKPKVSVILITGHGNIETAVEAMKLGAFDYVTKPLVDNEIKIIIQKISEQRKLIEENILLKEELAGIKRNSYCSMIGGSLPMQKIYTMIETIAGTKATVLITGESGTGKRLIALAVHQNDPIRKNNRFVEISCGALPENLLESELFGHIKGSFTGAIKDRKGRFELADKGTIFLDEIDTFTTPLQVKLLRVLQEGEFENVGDAKTIKTDTRIIAATNQNLETLIKTGKFREDLYYRLNVIPIHIPPLRERKEDIPALTNYFIDKFNLRNNTHISGISKDILDLFSNYNWPGNIRELENTIEHAVIIAKSDKITRAHIPAHLFRSEKTIVEGSAKSLKDIISEPEKQTIITALNNAAWNKKRTAEVLGINRCTLYNKMKKYNIKSPPR
ncbi:MAG: sigma-54 dependent transcriptional regulator [Candidatus Omnitrophota bacterium]|nr:sigma-54 dependent transcriptional regulator [Candidatus Omnitrophota bacterium]